jgi:hypothetical protein
MDERTNVLLNTLQESMERETGLFSRLALDVERLKASFQEKNWGESIRISEGIERIAQNVEEADIARDAAFSLLRDALGLPRETAFSALLPSLPDDERKRVEEAWRSLRMTVLRLKTATGRMRYSAEALSDTLNRMLNEVFPYRRGKIYSRRGTPTTVTSALIIDKKG